jgi:hypothetical protein
MSAHRKCVAASVGLIEGRIGRKLSLTGFVEVKSWASGIYEDWNRKLGPIHLADCTYCKDGRGTQPADSGQNVKWHGPLDRKTALFVGPAPWGKEPQFDHPRFASRKVCELILVEKSRSKTGRDGIF